MRFTVTTDIPQVADRIRRLSQRMDDLSEPMAGIGGILETSITDRIRDTKKSPDGSDWADVAGKERSQILIGIGGQQSGLLGSITHVAGEKSVIAGSSMLYAKYHQTGTRKMPARAFLGLSADDVDEINALLGDWLSGSLNG